MRHSLPTTILPGALAVVAVAALVVWASVGPRHSSELRIPEMDRPPGALAGRPAAPLVGKLETFAGQPADLPGRWPWFRGERLDGIAHDTPPLARSWPEDGPPRLWSLELGDGYAGAVIQDGAVYVLDYLRDLQADALRSFSLADGSEIWRFSYPVEVKRNHGMSRTVPAVTEQFCVAVGPKCHASSVNPKTGQEHWLVDLVDQFGATVPPWYNGQCPLVEDGRVILAIGGDSLLIAVDGMTGEVIWKSPNPRGWVLTHASIVPMEFAGRRMYVYCGKGGVAGIDAEDGSYLWDSTEWRISIATVPSPVVLSEGRIFFSGGYNAGALMMQLEEDAGRIAAKPLFRLNARQFGSTQHTPVHYEGHLYGVRESDKQFVCLDLEGNEAWRSGSGHRFGLGPYLLADGLFFILDDDGQLTLAEATPAEYRQLATARVVEGHESWGLMALAGGRLILREMTTMVCLDVAEGAAGVTVHRGTVPSFAAQRGFFSQ